MEILFLGTSAATPSTERTTSCIAVRSGADVVLMDCGEGSQQRIMASPVSFMKIRAVLITHLHGDHVFGLPGLIHTMSLNNRKSQLTVCGPPGIGDFVNATMLGCEPSYAVTVYELSGGETFSVGSLTISSFPTEHGTDSVGYVVSEPDRPGRLDRNKAVLLGINDGPEMALLKKGESVRGVSPEDVIGPPIRGLRIAYTGDTRASASVAKSVRKADVLIHEATYMSADAGNADRYAHSTAAQAAAVAKQADVRFLILTHISHRYGRDEIEEEARKIFTEAYAAEDLTSYTVTEDGLSVRSLRE